VTGAVFRVVFHDLPYEKMPLPCLKSAIILEFSLVFAQSGERAAVLPIACLNQTGRSIAL